MMIHPAVVVAFACGLVATESFVTRPASFGNRTGGGGGTLLDYRLTEESPAGTRIGNLAIDSGLTVEHGHSEAGSYRYSLLPSAFWDYFDVETTGGLLKTSDKSFDRDGLCGNRLECAASLDVYVDKGLGEFQLFKVRVFVEDVNDNSPLFQPDRLSLFVSEATPPGTTFLISAATDLDVGQFDVKSYRLDDDDGSGVLRLEAPDSTDARQLRLVLETTMDRETERRLRLRITAVDGGIPPRTGVLTVDVVVQDANDNSPVFLEKIYSIAVEEAKTFKGPLLRVSATDPDEGDNGRVVYDFDKATLASHGSDFAIGNTTGEIFLRRGLDFERRSSYELVVMASDMGLGSLPGTAHVVVTVTDVNDNAPKIYVVGDTQPAGATAHGRDTVHWVSVQENQSSDAFVAQLYVKDEDSGQNGEVICSTASADFRLEKKHEALAGLFQLTSSVPLDRELRSQFTVSLQCADRGIPPHVSRETITVFLTDINDNAPRFTESEYVAELTEETESGVSLLTVTAVDGDSDENGRVSYHLVGDFSAGELVIDGETGVIRTGKSPVDRETVESLVFSVAATDHGTPSLTASVTVRVKIVDVNDIAPQFSEASYTFFCAENLPPGTWIGNVYAIDVDQPPFNAFRYSIALASHPESANILSDDNHKPFISEMNKLRAIDFLHGSRSTTHSSLAFSSSNEIPFEIDHTLGGIRTTKTLDREWQSSFSFLVVATDVEPPYLSSKVRVRVRVTDANDNAPVIQSPAPEASILVPLNTEVGSTVLRVAATDADDALNSKIHYSIVPGYHDELFHIDPDNGDIRLARSPPSTSLNESYQLLVLVSDAGHPRLTANASITLTFSEGGPGKAEKSVAVTSLRHNETVLLVVLGATSCVAAMLIVAIWYTKRLQLEEAVRAKQARYFDVRTAGIEGLGGSNRSGTVSSVCLESPSPLLLSSDNDRSRSSCLEECDSGVALGVESPTADSVRGCYNAGEKAVQLRRNDGKAKKTAEPRHSRHPADVVRDSSLSINAPSLHPSFSNLPSRTVRGQEHSTSRGSPSSYSRTTEPASNAAAAIPRPRSSTGIKFKSGEDEPTKGRLSQGECLPLGGAPVAPVHRPPRYSHLDQVKSTKTALFHLDNGEETNCGVQNPSYYSNNNTTITGNLKWNSNPDSGTMTSTIVPSWV